MTKNYINSAIEKNNFNLISFNSDNVPPIKINGNISKIDNQLNIKYLLTGDLSTIIIPQSNKTPLRQYDLWEHTCFELFLKLKGTTRYWEFNLAPSGNWNVFYFLDYRLNIIEEQAFESFPFKVAFQSPESLIAEANIDLSKLDITNKDLDIAITTVLENKDGQLSYWALTHPAIEADFHHPNSFIVSL